MTPSLSKPEFRFGENGQAGSLLGRTIDLELLNVNYFMLKPRNGMFECGC